MENSRSRGRTVVVWIVIGFVGLAGLFLTAAAGPSTSPAGPEALPDLVGGGEDRQSPPPPFYTPPATLPVDLPGTILKSEPMPEAPPGIESTRIMYLSTGANGKPTAVTGMITQLKGPVPPGGRPLVAFAHGTIGIGRECNMSQGPFTPGYSGAGQFDPRIRPLVNQGYVVATSDYEGEGAPGTPTYEVKATEGFNVLDSLRAAVYLRPQDINAAKMAIYGHSQGGHAALSAATLAPEYAPELQLRGVVSSAPGLIPPLPLALQTLIKNPGTAEQGTIRAAYILNIAASWSATFPDEFKATDLLTPAGVAAIPLALKYCTGALREHLTEPFDHYVRTDPPNTFLNLANENMPVHDRIEMPVLLMQGLKDTDVVPALTIAASQSLCQLGTTLQLHTTANDTHETLIWAARPTELDWIADRFASKPAPNNCGGQQ